MHFKRGSKYAVLFIKVGPNVGEEGGIQDNGNARTCLVALTLWFFSQDFGRGRQLISSTHNNSEQPFQLCECVAYRRQVGYIRCTAK